MLKPERRSTADSEPAPALARIVLILLWLTLAMTVAIQLWAVRRGFDITDEGLYLLELSKPHANIPGVTQFELVATLGSGGRHLGIVGWRLLGLVMTIASCGLLGLALSHHVRTPSVATSERHVWIADWKVTAPFSILTGTLAYGVARPTVSYINMNASLVALEIALLLWAIGPRRARRAPAGKRPGAQETTGPQETTGAQETNGPLSRVRRSVGHQGALVAPVLTGILLGFHLFVRWPTAVLMTGVLAVAHLYFVKPWRRGLVNVSVLMMAAAATIVLTAQDFVGRWFSLDAMLSSARTASDSTAHNPGGLMSDYLADIKRFAGLGFGWVGLAVGVVGLVFLIQSRVSRRAARLLLGLVGAVGVVSILWRGHGSAQGYMERVDWVVGLILGAATVIALARRQASTHADAGAGGDAHGDTRVDVTRAVALAWLSVAAVGASVVGSLSPILGRTSHAAAPIAVALTLALAVLIESGFLRNSGAALVIVAFCGAGGAYATYGTVFDPYRVPTDLLQQTHSVQGVGPLNGIRVDQASAEMFQELADLVADTTTLSPDDPILALSQAPGLVYALDGTAPGTAWIPAPVEGKQRRTCETFRAHPDQVRQTKLVLQVLPIGLEMRDCLPHIWPDFPNNLVEIGRVQNAYSRVVVDRAIIAYALAEAVRNDSR